ncbi:uncharacterized protein LOC131625965 [Vicia villosa]|uniref:uncharacterized protein LOC131625965 n=1 Tax=Vicia villosa TaxID=3911 RepID=UPI00273BFB02|nr:uncharacterized protein LOC131625965 [Vicia villosa]
MAYSYYNHPFYPTFTHSHYSTPTIISAPPSINPHPPCYYSSSNPPFSTSTPHQQHIPFAPPQPQPQNFFSQPETLRQLEILKQYITETHEMATKSREELKEQIENLSNSFKASSQEFLDVQRKRLEKFKKIIIETKPEQQQEEEEKFHDSLQLLPTVNPIVFPESFPAKSPTPTVFLRTPATTLISIPAAYPTTAQSFSLRKFPRSSLKKTYLLLSPGKTEPSPAETIVLPPKQPDSPKPPPKPPDLQQVLSAPEPPPFNILHLRPPSKPPDFQSSPPSKLPLRPLDL